ncbi:MAG: cupin domain-containing protein [Bacteroidetes bacterium]|nr:MAG: cupin domain-containing protein [Bacteroidota bacterium]
MTAEYWIKHLQLSRHPEGGFFREVYRSQEQIEAQALPPRFGGARSLATSIYFLITPEGFSALHRLKADELWHFYAGQTLELHLILPDGSYRKLLLGSQPKTGATFQAVVPAACWFGARLADPGPQAYALLGCTMAPGFDFADFELGSREQLLKQYPHHSTLIRSLTRV